MSYRPRILLFICIACFASSQPGIASNFNCDLPAFKQQAEQARLNSANFWTEQPLPGNWSMPCPIQYQISTQPGSGRTSFQYSGGEVHSWSMFVTGTRNSILEDVIPHEVDHMVRASLVRKPIVRWLDEGCATLFESHGAQQKLRTIARNMSPTTITPTWLGQQSYPASDQQMTAVYALGFSLVEFLLERGSPQVLLQLQRDSDQIEAGLKQHYGLTVADLQKQWERFSLTRNTPDTAWNETSSQHVFDRSESCGCQPRLENLLEVWGAEWCGPCQKFRDDYLRDADFRNQLRKHFHIHFCDVDHQPALAATRNIHKVPTFLWTAGRVQGYTDANTLLRQLGIKKSIIPNPQVIRSPPDDKSLIVEEEQQKVPEQKHPRPTLKTVPNSIPANKDSKKSTQQTPQPATVSTVAKDHHQSASTMFKELMIRLAPIGWSTLQWSSVLGGVLATGGAGGLALSVFFLLWNRRHKRHLTEVAQSQSDRRAEPTAAPFPRHLDEARQLLELRQSEGRVAILDALRGMFLDDELEKIKARQTPQVSQQFDQLRTAIDARIEEVAPLSTAEQ